MTFFLDDAQKELQPVRSVAPVRMFDGGLSAATSKTMLETNANLRLQREENDESSSVTKEAIKRMGEADALALLKDKGLAPPMLETLQGGDLLRYNDQARAALLEEARSRAAADPAAWEGVDLSDEGMKARVDERLRAEHEDATSALDAMTSGRGITELFGGMVGMTADIRNLPFLFMGGGSGSILSVMGREAAINVAAEAVTLPSQFEMAKRLDVPNPDVVSQLSIAAGAGAVLGGAISGIGRALEYYRGRQAISVPDGAPAGRIEAGIQAVDDAIANGENPLVAVQRVMREPLILTNPLREPLILTDAERVKLPSDTAQIAPAMPTEAQAFDQVIADARAADAKASRPLIQMLRGKGSTYKIHPDGEFGKELKAMGVDAKSFPGLFSKSGRRELDNLVASDMEQAFPGIIDATGTQRGADYLDRQGLLDLIRREANGDSSWLQTRQEVMQLERMAAEAKGANGKPVDDFLAHDRADDGFFVDLNQRDFDPSTDVEAWNADMEVRFNDWIEQRGFRLLDDEREEIITELRQRGGDAEYLVERAFERERDDFTAEMKDAKDGFIPFGDPGEAQGGMAARSGADPFGPEPAAASGGAGRTPAPERASTEQTVAGKQFIAPGTERRAAPTGMTERARAEMQARAQQSKIRRLDQTRVEDDPAGLFTQAQRDMFDDPAGPQAREWQLSIADDLRTQIERGSPKQTSPRSEWEQSVRYDDDQITFMRGHGRESRGSVYAGAAAPIMGEGKYYFMGYKGSDLDLEELAKPFGPKIDRRSDMAGREFLWISDAQDWRELAKEAGWRYPNPHGVKADELSKMVADLKSLVIAKGYDGISIDPIHSDKLIDDVFGPKQIVVYDRKASDGDFMVDMGDGRGERSASSVLDELDADDEFSAMLDLCGKPRGNA